MPAIRLLNSVRQVRLVPLGLGLVAAGLVAWALTSLPNRAALRPPVSATQAVVTVSPDGAAVPVPRSYLGISTEYWTLPIWARHLGLLEKVLAVLHVPGEGPLVMRIGGDSADHVYWEPSGGEAPDWAFELTPNWLQQAGQLVAQSGVKLILDLNYVTATPGIAALWARAADAQLPRRSLLGFEIGNEPDIYSRLDWRSTLAGTAAALRLLPQHISARGYARDFRSYARVLARVAPGVPLLAPALALPHSNAGWISTLLAGPHPGLGVISVHRYPYSACAPVGSRRYPTINRILSEAASAGMAQGLRSAIAIAHRHGLPVRLTELNSVTCGGLPGVSNSFATALWAPDALFELMRAGVSAADVHVREYTVNAAFVITDRGLVANPLLYGLIAFTKMLGPGARLMPVRVQSSRPVALKAWAVTVAGRTLRVLVIDKGPRPVRVLLHLPASGTASVQRLLARSAAARSGVTLGGQHLDAAGNWRGRATGEVLPPGPGGYLLSLPRQSAALLSVRLAPPRRSASARARARAGGQNRRARRAHA